VGLFPFSGRTDRRFPGNVDNSDLGYLGDPLAPNAKQHGKQLHGEQPNWQKACGC
jgi:hypothetical protein